VGVRPPSGEQFEIVHGDQRVVTVELGGGLRTYSVGERDVRYGVERLTGSSSSTSSKPQPGYLFTLELDVEYELSESGLTVRPSATNAGADPRPYGSRAHPCLNVGTPTVDDVMFRVPARTALRSNERGIPIGSVPVDGTELDFRSPRPIDGTKLDHGYADLERDDDGLARVELHAGHGGRSVTLWLDEVYRYVMVFTGDRPDVDRRGLAVEPMTCPLNAFRSGDGLIRLETGESVTATWGLTPS
jgi:aldose 1-epimerase